jgi:hypothetical protein
MLIVFQAGKCGQVKANGRSLTTPLTIYRYPAAIHFDNLSFDRFWNLLDR